MNQDPDPMAFPLPDDDPLWAPFWDAARDGRLDFMRCPHCRHAFLPARDACPSCLSRGPAWETAAGRARLISWVVYHRAPDPAFEDRVPYTAAIVELEEGPRMITNIVGVDDPEALRIEEPLTLRIEQEAGVAVPRFAPVQGRAQQDLRP